MAAGQMGCDIGARLAYYICLWFVIGIVGIWFFVGIIWMAAIWFTSPESSLLDTMESLGQIELEDASNSGPLSDV
jgi:hypothetical protein